MQQLLDNGIASRRGIMTSHRETAYRNISPDISLPNSEDLADRSIIIPLFVPMSEVEILHLINVFIRILKSF